MEGATFNPVLPVLREADITGQFVIAKAARWLLETTSNRADQLAAAQLIFTLDSRACALAFDEWRAWQSILSLTLEAFNVWYSQQSSRNQNVAQLLGSVWCHTLAQVLL